MGQLTDRIKELGTIQPTDCRCLPELTKSFLEAAIIDSIVQSEQNITIFGAALEKYPNVGQRSSKLLHENPQYQKGLVTAKDLQAFTTPEYISELRDSISAHRYLLQMIRTIPACRS